MIMSRTQLPVERLFEERFDNLELRLIAGRGGVHRNIESPRVQKQGLILLGVASAERPGPRSALGQTSGKFIQIHVPPQSDPPELGTDKCTQFVQACFASSD